VKNRVRMFLLLALAVALCAPFRADAAEPATPPATPPAAAPLMPPVTPPATRKPAPRAPAAPRSDQNAPAAVTTDAAAPAQGTVRITLAAVPLSAVVLYISEYAGKPVLLPDRFAGDRTVDVISSGGADVPQAKAIEILAAALRNAGYSMIEHPDYIQIVTEGQTGAPVRDSYPETGLTAQTLLTMVVDIKNADANNLQPILDGLKSKSGSVRVYKDFNKLIITEQGAQLRGMLDLIARLDTKWADNVTEQVKLEQTSVEALSGVVGNYIHNLAAGADPLVKQRLANFSSFAHSPTNSFVLFGNPQDILRVKQFIRSLDVSADAANRSYHTYFVLNRDAADLVSVLNGIFSAVNARAAKDAPSAPVPSVIPDPVNGAIIVICAPDKYKEILPLLKELDKAKAQVLIESALVEMSMDRLMDLGVELASLDRPGENARGFGTTTFGMSTVTAAGRVPVLPAEGGLTAGIFKDNALNIAALLRLSQSDGNISFIAAPRLMASDNKPATVKISELREYQKSIISPEGTTSEVTGGNFNEASITLDIIPHINEEGTVRLEIAQTTEQFLPSTEGSNGQELVNKTSRFAKTEVLVPEGTTVVIAGLTRTVESKRVAKVPLLGSLPGLGFLFRRTTTTNEQRNLCIFITPTILRGRAALAAQAEMRKDEMVKSAAAGGIPMSASKVEVIIPSGGVKGAGANGN